MANRDRILGPGSQDLEGRGEKKHGEFSWDPKDQATWDPFQMAELHG